MTFLANLNWLPTQALMKRIGSAKALFDTSFGSGSVAGFSLRTLSKDMVGQPVVRVRRSLDDAEQDIGLTKDGLDETALLDFVAPSVLPGEVSGLTAGFSLRYVTSTYSGPVVRVRRSVDDAEQDFTPIQITDGSLETFVGAGNNGFVNVWYDQSGNNNDAVQITASQQPRIVSNGSIVLDNGIPAIDWIDKTVPMSLRTSFNSDIIGAASVFGVANAMSGESRQLFFDGLSSQFFFGYDSSLAVLEAGRGDAQTINDSNFNQNVFSIKYDEGNSLSSVNQTEQGVAASVGNNDIDGVSIGDIRSSASSSNYSFGGTFQELLIYDNNVYDTNKVAIETNLNDYYNVYTDSNVYDGFVTSWYSQGELTPESSAFSGTELTLSYYKRVKTYTGSCLRVRRSSDDAEQDIGFVDNYIDLDALIGFVGAGNDGFITTWYDQSINGRNVVQTNASNQPLCVEAGVVTKNNSDAPSPRFISNFQHALKTVSYSPAHDSDYSISLVEQAFDTSASYAMSVRQSDLQSSYSSNFIIPQNVNTALWYRSKTIGFGSINRELVDVNTLIYEFQQGVARIFGGSSLLGSVGSASGTGNVGGLVIGGRADQTTSFWDGTISELIIHSRFLNSEEKNYINNTQQNFFNEGALTVNNILAATQTTASAQPKIVSDGSPILEGVYNSIDFDGVDDFLNLPNNLYIGTDGFYIVHVSEFNASSGSGVYTLLGNNGNADKAIITNEIGIRTGGGFVEFGAPVANMSLETFYKPSGPSNIFDARCFVNGVERSRVDGVDNTWNFGTTTENKIMTAEVGGSENSGPIDGTVTELILFPAANFSNRSSIDNDLIRYYNTD